MEQMFELERKKMMKTMSILFYIYIKDNNPIHSQYVSKIDI